MIKLSALTLVIAQVALAQVAPWKYESSSVPSTRAGDPTVMVFDGPPHYQVLIGTDIVQVGAVSSTIAPGMPISETVAVGPAIASDARSNMLIISGPNNQLFAFELNIDGIQPLLPASFSVLSPGALAMRQLGADDFELWVDTRSSALRQFLVHREDGGVTYTAQAVVTLPQSATGVAIDGRNGQVFVALPSRGIAAVYPDGGVELLASIDAGNLGAVVGGIDVLPLLDGGTWLFEAAASNERVTVHELDLSTNSLTFIGAVAIGQPDGGGGRVRLPQHLDLFEPLVDFPRGLLVVQDGVTGTYKLVSLDELDAVLPLPAVARWDAGSDAGPDDGGTDAGTDAGMSDAGITDAGQSDGGGGGGGSGGRPGQMGGIMETPSGCSCGNPFLVFLPAALLLWWIRRPRYARD